MTKPSSISSRRFGSIRKTRIRGAIWPRRWPGRKKHRPGPSELAGKTDSVTPTTEPQGSQLGDRRFSKPGVVADNEPADRESALVRDHNAHPGGVAGRQESPAYHD